MKRLFLILIFTLGISLISFSQNRLTVGQVYNFNVGDIFEVENYTEPPQNAPIYYLTTVLAKWYSAHSDTVFYKDSMDTYALPTCSPPCVGTFSTYMETVSYTNLDSIAVQENQPNSCPPVWDSIYVDSSKYCGKKVWEQAPSVNCLDTNNSNNPTVIFSSLIEGCGGPYYNLFWPEDEALELNAFNEYYTLVYYKKHDTVCGTEFVITGINQISPAVADLKIHPNPSPGKFNITYSNPKPISGEQTIEVFNVLGEQVYSGTLKQVQGDYQINLSSQPNGIYLYRVIAKDGSFIGDGKLIIQK